MTVIAKAVQNVDNIEKAKLLAKSEQDRAQKEELSNALIQREQEAVMAKEALGQGIPSTVDRDLIPASTGDPQLDVINPTSTDLPSREVAQAPHKPKYTRFEEGSMSKDELIAHIKENFDVDESGPDASLLSRLRAFKEKRDGAGDSGGDNKRYQSKAFEDSEGNIRLGVFDTKTGKLTKTSDLAGFKAFTGKNPVTGEIGRLATSGKGNELSQVGTKGISKVGYNVAQALSLKELKEDFTKDAINIKHRTAISASDTALSLLNSNNPIADRGIRLVFPRMLGEVGNLTQAEQDAFSGSGAIEARVNATLQRWKDGKLTEPDRIALRGLANVLQKSAQSKLALSARDYSRTFALRERTLSEEDALQQLVGVSKLPSRTKAEPKKKPKTEAAADKKPRSKLKSRKKKNDIITIRGVKYIRGSDGKYFPNKK